MVGSTRSKFDRLLAGDQLLGESLWEPHGGSQAYKSTILLILHRRSEGMEDHPGVLWSFDDH